MQSTESSTACSTTQSCNERGPKHMPTGIRPQELCVCSARPVHTCTMSLAGAWLGGESDARCRPLTVARATTGAASLSSRPKYAATTPASTIVCTTWGQWLRAAPHRGGRSAAAGTSAGPPGTLHTFLL